MTYTTLSAESVVRLSLGSSHVTDKRIFIAIVPRSSLNLATEKRVIEWRDIFIGLSWTSPGSYEGFFLQILKGADAVSLHWIKAKALWKLKINKGKNFIVAYWIFLRQLKRVNFLSNLTYVNIMKIVLLIFYWWLYWLILTCILYFLTN